MPDKTDPEVLLLTTQYVDVTNQIFGKVAEFLGQLEQDASAVRQKAERDAKMMKAANLLDASEHKIAVDQLLQHDMALDILANVLSAVREEKTKAAAVSLGAASGTSNAPTVKRSCVVDERRARGDAPTEADYRAASRYGISLG